MPNMHNRPMNFTLEKVNALMDGIMETPAINGFMNQETMFCKSNLIIKVEELDDLKQHQQKNLHI